MRAFWRVERVSLSKGLASICTSCISQRELAWILEVISWVYGDILWANCDASGSSGLVSCAEHAAQPTFSKQYETRMIKSGYNVLAFLLVQNDLSESMKKYTGRSRELLYEHSTAHVLNAENSIQVTPPVNGMKWKKLILHRTIRIVLSDLKTSCTARLSSGTRSQVKRNPFSLPSSFCRDIHEGANKKGNVTVYLWGDQATDVRKQWKL